MIGAGILTVDEVRQNMGLLPLAQVTHPLAGAGMVAANVKKIVVYARCAPIFASSTRTISAPAQQVGSSPPPSR
jgi:hypothetical protein